VTSVSIIDYGVGNLLSVARAFNFFGADVNIVNTPEEIMKAQRVVLPGVGAFKDGMNGLREFGFIESIKSFAKTGKPFMGICLGMQMMLTKSMEFGEYSGLDLISGEVVPIPSYGSDGIRIKIPHIGWNKLIPVDNGRVWDDSILKNTLLNSSVYFAHSFMAIPSHPSTRLADTLYDGQIISSLIREGNIYGCQFHPEKSGTVGLGIVEQFLKI